MEEFAHIFEEVADPRRSDATLRDSDGMPMISLPPALCGCGGCADMERYGRAEEGFPRGFMRLAHGIPSRDAFTDPFDAPDPGDLRRAMLRPAEGRSNGITAVPTLLEMPTPKGRVVTADAMHTQHRTAQAVSAAGGECVPAPKGDRGAPYEDAKPCLNDPAQDGNWLCHHDVDGKRGRIGTGTARVVRDIDWFQQQHRRLGLAAVGRVVPRPQDRGRDDDRNPPPHHGRQALPAAVPARGAQPSDDREPAASGVGRDHERGSAA